MTRNNQTKKIEELKTIKPTKKQIRKAKKVKARKVNLNTITALKQKEVLKKYIKQVKENKGTSLVKAGEGIYSKNYLEDGQLQRTDTWQALVNKYLPDSLLAKKHQELLNKEKILYKENKKGDIEAVHTGEIDTQAVKAGLDLGYRIKGKNQDTLTIKKTIEDMSDEELSRLIKEEQAKLTKTD